jgi:hypothetical protein
MRAFAAGKQRRGAFAAGAILLLAAAGTGLLALGLLPRPKTAAPWSGFRVILVDASVPESEVLPALDGAGFKDVLSESTEPVLVSNWSGLESMSLGEAESRLDREDPRFDSYLERLGLWFHAKAAGAVYRVYYIREPSVLGFGLAGDGRLRACLYRLGAPYLAPDSQAAISSPADTAPASCLAEAILLFACLAGPLSRSFSGRKNPPGIEPRRKSLRRIALRLALSLPWAILAWGGLTAACLAALWALVAAEAADSLDLPLDEFRRGGSFRAGLSSLAAQRFPSFALVLAALFASIANASSLASVSAAVLGSIAAGAGFALLSTLSPGRRRFVPMPISRRAGSRVLSGAAALRLALACAVVLSWGLVRLFPPSGPEFGFGSASALSSEALYPVPATAPGSARPLIAEARRRAASEKGEALAGLASYLEHRARQEALPYASLGDTRPDPFAPARLPAPGLASSGAGVEFGDDWARKAYASVPPLSVEGMLMSQGRAVVGRLGAASGEGGRPLAPIECLLYIFLLVPPLGRLFYGAPFGRGDASGELRQEA